ncbi:MAG TPA: hypothetical protein VN223_04000 [Candidatus Elarobacter sp.]|nr:hypothetical protein [Candidatus Elarobacter sp.]
MRILDSYKGTYLRFIRAIRQTLLVSAVAEHSLRNFPKGLPPAASRATVDLFEKVSSSLLAAVSHLDSKNTDPQSKKFKIVTKAQEKSKRQSDREAAEIAMHALHLMLAMDFKKTKYSRLSQFRKQFQILARHQAVAMVYAHVDAFFGDTLRIICQVKPEVLRSGKQLTWETALKFQSIEDLRDMLSEQFINEFGWKALPDRLEFFQTKFGVDLELPVTQLQMLSLFEQRRHLIIHNGGVVSARYIANTGDKHVKIGQQISISREEVRLLGDVVVRFGSRLCSTTAIQFLGAKLSDLTQVWQESKSKHEQDSSV